MNTLAQIRMLAVGFGDQATAVLAWYACRQTLVLPENWGEVLLPPQPSMVTMRLKTGVPSNSASRRSTISPKLTLLLLMPSESTLLFTR